MARKTPQDPTGLSTDRAKAYKQLANRLAAVEREVKARFRAIPRQSKTVTPIKNEQNVTFIYDLTAAQETILASELRGLIAEALGTTADESPGPDWFWRGVVEMPYRRATLEHEVELNQLIAQARALGVLTPAGMLPEPVPPGAILTSRAYADDLAKAYIHNYAEIKGLNDRTSAQVIDRIRRGMRAGKSPSDIAKDISERFNVARSSAKRIADTEINAAYNTARLQAAKRVEQQTGLIAGVMHISALLPTTRETHADRHGNVYTPEDQAEWWSEGANRINCHCTTRTVLVDQEGRILEQESR